MSWATEEFAEVNLGDKRLNARLIKLCDRFSDSPESPINQACIDWAETKAAYRFFKNDNVEVEKILDAHCAKTAQRAKKHQTVLALQDTSYFVYTNHLRTRGLGKISLKKGKNVDKIYSVGLMMHTCLAVTTTGLPLGLLDQQIVARQLRTKTTGKAKPHDRLPVEEKESYRWLSALENANTSVEGYEVVTVCDREADFYDLFRCGYENDVSLLVRANTNRTINRSSRYAEKGVEKLWEYMRRQPEAGSYTIPISQVNKTRHRKKRNERIATVNVRYAKFILNPPRNHFKYNKEELPDIEMYAIYAQEPYPPNNVEAIEWMLLTNIPVSSFDSAYEKIRWYCLRWRIEMFFKFIKSGFRAEACRLSHGNRLARYLTIISIVAWRLFLITLIARTEPSTPCNRFMSESEWKVLFMKEKKGKPFPKEPPSIDKIVIWISKLGGYLDRENDGPPGTVALWRGWKRLADLTEGWNLATNFGICG